MTDNEIIKALECCKKDDCDNCPNDFGNCYANLAACSLDLINRKQAENEELRIENQSLRSAANSYKLHYNKARAEAIKEFAERLKNGCAFECNVSLGYGRPCYEDAIPIIAINNLVKEMAGDTE